jgi:hypothetical protein
MIQFPPEFYGLVTALWSTYQYIILIWMALTFAGIAIIGFGAAAWKIVRDLNPT